MSILCKLGLHKKVMVDENDVPVAGTFRTIGETLYEKCERCPKRWWFRFDPPRH